MAILQSPGLLAKARAVAVVSWRPLQLLEANIDGVAAITPYSPTLQVPIREVYSLRSQGASPEPVRHRTCYADIFVPELMSQPQWCHRIESVYARRLSRLFCIT
jgi:hypothetical protein